VAIGPLQGAALRDRVIADEASRTLEIGLGYAISTLFICEGLLQNGAGGRHVAIDPFQQGTVLSDQTLFGGAGLRTLQRAGVRSMVELYDEGSEIVLPRLLSAGRTFDFAFVDGSHRFENVFLDLVFCGRLLTEAATVFVDDSHMPSVSHAIAYCTSNLGWSVESSGTEAEERWSVLRTGPRERLSRSFTEFTPW
jgi:predicted O-methyltransferase YrrM